MITRNIGFLLLAIYLILLGLSTFIPGMIIPPVIMGGLAVVSGICILIQK